MAFTTLLATVVVAVAASSGPHCSTGNASCSTASPLRATAPVLLQRKTKLGRKAGLDVDKTEWRSDCSQRLGHGHTHPAACVVIKDNKALLVYVPYGRPGWDLPGGWHKGGHEPDCETAEREACEETHHQVKAVQRITGNVFRCDIKVRNVCHRSVDEGFLRKGWFGLEELDNLNFRPYTWGNKRGLIRAQLRGSAPHHPATPTDPDLKTGRVDSCGCRIGQEGWSTGASGCRYGAWTSPKEAAACSQRQNDRGSARDACGCKIGQQGWSTSAGQCRSGSWTSPGEVTQCQRRQSQLQEEANPTGDLAPVTVADNSSLAPAAASSPAADPSLATAAATSALTPGSADSSTADSSLAPVAAPALTEGGVSSTA